MFSKFIKSFILQKQELVKHPLHIMQRFITISTDSWISKEINNGVIYLTESSSSENQKRVNANSKNKQLEKFRVRNAGHPLTTNQSRKVSDDERILTAGDRGPGVMEDVQFLKKSHILSTKKFLKEKFMREDTAHMVFLSVMNR